jgi:hypothetical protein
MCQATAECNFAVRLYANLVRVEKARGCAGQRSLGYRCRLATISGRRAISFDPGNLADKLLRNYSGGSTVARLCCLPRLCLCFRLYIPQGGFGSSHQAVSCGRSLLEKPRSEHVHRQQSIEPKRRQTLPIPSPRRQPRLTASSPPIAPVLVCGQHHGGRTRCRE